MWLNVSEKNVMVRTGIGSVSVGASLYRAAEQNIFDQVAKDRMWARGLCGHCTDADLTMGILRVSIPADIATCVYLRVYARQDFTRLHISRHLQRMSTHKDAVGKGD